MSKQYPEPLSSFPLFGQGLRSCTRSLVLAAFVTAYIFIITIPVQAVEEIVLRTLFADPMSYQLHVVSLKGTAKDVQAMTPVVMGYGKAACLISGRGTFVLDDGTDSITINVPGACWPGVASLPEEGDYVAIQVVITVLKTQLPIRVEGLAQSIEIIDKPQITTPR